MAFGQLISLQKICYLSLMRHLEDIPQELIAALPTQLRRDLFLHLPVADVCVLLHEAAPTAEGIDDAEVWKELYSTRLPKISVKEMNRLYGECRRYFIPLNHDIAGNEATAWQLPGYNDYYPPLYRYLGRIPEFSYTKHGYYSAIASVVVSQFQLLQDNPSDVEGERIANLLCSVPLANFAQTERDPGSDFEGMPFEEVLQWVVPPRYSSNISDPPRTGTEMIKLLVDCFQSLPSFLTVYMMTHHGQQQCRYHFADSNTNQLDGSVIDFISNVQCLELFKISVGDSSSNDHFSPLLPFLKCQNHLANITLTSAALTAEHDGFGIALTELIPVLSVIISRPHFSSLTLDSSLSCTGDHPSACCFLIHFSELKELLKIFYSSPCDGPQVLSFISVCVVQDSDDQGMASLMSEFRVEDTAAGLPKTVHFRGCSFTVKDMYIHALQA